jgi:hypothetical protein
MTTSLAAAPNLEQIKKQAKDLLKSLRAADPSGLERLRAKHPKFSSASPEDAHGPILSTEARRPLARRSPKPKWSFLAVHSCSPQPKSPWLLRRLEPRKTRPWMTTP